MLTIRIIIIIVHPGLINYIRDTKIVVVKMYSST